MDKRQALKAYFGYDEFREGQERLIDDILAGRDAMCIMPTGAGKSMCFQLPAMLLPGITVVVSPLISLMKDQVGALVQSGVPAAYFNSSLTDAQYSLALKRAIAGAYKLIYAAPERLLTERFLDMCRSVDVSLVAVDEAHCVSQWGQDFRPSYMDVPVFVSKLQTRPPVAAFTATATSRVKLDIEELLRLKDPARVTTGFDRPNLRFEVRRPKNKNKELLKIISEHPDDSGIVYCSTRKAVESVSDLLVKNGVSAARYHAGLSDAERRESQDDFRFDRVRVIVATNAFGMGIDKPNVRFVVHYNMPKDMESYYQEAGRAGRDSLGAVCVLLFGAQDVNTARFLIESGSERDALPPDIREQVVARDYERLRVMTDYCHSTKCLRSQILRYFGEDAPERCGTCLNCDGEFSTVDVTGEALAILGFVRDMRGRLGAKTAIDVLRGSGNKRIIEWNMDRRSDYGSLSGTKPETLREVIGNLVANEYLVSTGGKYPTLELGRRAQEVLSGGRVTMRVDKQEVAGTDRREEYRVESGAKQLNGELFDRLRLLRRRLADEQGVPAFVVFSDASLADMCKKLPATADEFLEVSGVGSRKLAQYGEEFIEVIRNYGAK